jgi:hypothetical protein
MTGVVRISSFARDGGEREGRRWEVEGDQVE